MNPSIAALPLADLLIVVACASVRTWVALALLPMFGHAMVPALARMALAFVVVLPVVWASGFDARPFELTLMSVAAFLLKEGAIGGLIGLGFGAFLAGLQTAGEIIDHQTGLTFTQNFDAVHGNSVSLTSQVLERVLFAALMAGGALLAVVDTLYLSYELWPMERAAPVIDRVMALQLAGEAGRIFAFSLLLAGPVLLALFIVDGCLGLMNRAAPQLNVSGIALSLKSIVGLGVLVLALPMIVQRALEGFVAVGRTLAQHFMVVR